MVALRQCSVFGESIHNSSRDSTCNSLTSGRNLWQALRMAWKANKTIISIALNIRKVPLSFTLWILELEA